MNNIINIPKNIQEACRDLLNYHEAMTISMHAQISSSIVDTQFIAVTQRASALFGYDNPSELEGKFTSTTHLLEDIQRTRLRSTLRALGLLTPLEQYEVRIVQRSGDLRRVVKHVEQMEIEGTMLWLCRLEAADTRLPFQPPALPDAVPEEALHRFFGKACVAEAEAFLNQQLLLLTSYHDMAKNSPIKTKQHPSLPVEPLALDAPHAYYKCHCLVCEREWIAGGKTKGGELPKRCNYTDCRAYAWNDPLASSAAKRKREERLARLQTRTSPT